jgi:cell division protein FtsI/penicillin-binding protein 2
MSSYRRRGAHAARQNALPFVAARRTPQSAAGGRAQPDGGDGGKRVSSLQRLRGSQGRQRLRQLPGLRGARGRTSMLRVIAAVVAIGLGAAGFAGGLWSSSSAEPTVQAFLLAWDQHQYRAAAAMTTGNQDVVARALRTAYRRLDAAAFYLSMGPISQHSGQADAQFHASVDLGQDGAPWNYQGHLTLVRAGSGWKIKWSPSVINPGLRPGLRLAAVTRVPPRAQLLDSTGGPLQQLSPAYVIGVQPARLASVRATATALGQATGLDPGQLEGQILAASQRPFLRLLTLSPHAYGRLRAGLDRVHGLVVRTRPQRLFASIAGDVVGSVGTEASPVLRNEGVAYHPGSTIGLSGLQQVYQRQLAGTPTTEVVAETDSGRQVSVLARWPKRPAAPAPVRTTINAGAQQAADSAVASAPASAAIVAVQASTGRVLGVADHQAPGLPRAQPLTGSYPPGEAFTIVSTAALLADGLKVTTPIRCTSRSDVGGRTFTNVPAMAGLGGQPAFAQDFAHSCGTALAGLSRVLTERQLAEAATGFGVGAGWRLPLASFDGVPPASGTVAGLAANTIGEGNVRVSPLGLALTAARVASGGWHSPSLVPDPPGKKVAASGVRFAPSTISALRSLMRGAVKSGAAARANLAGLPVYGQVGVAPAGGKIWASWFVGYRGDVAFAVLELSRSPSNSAVPAGAQFLSGIPGH